MIKLIRSPLVAYLLHFRTPVGRCRHYLGSTMEHLLEQRLRSHAKGRGARLTARAFRSGTEVHLVDVSGLLSRQQEHDIKAKGHYERRCPVCQGLTLLENTRRICTDISGPPPWDPVEYR